MEQYLLHLISASLCSFSVGQDVTAEKILSEGSRLGFDWVIFRVLGRIYLTGAMSREDAIWAARGLMTEN